MLLREVIDRFVETDQTRTEVGGRFSTTLPAAMSMNSNSTRRLDRERITLVECAPETIAADSSSWANQTVSLMRMLATRLALKPVFTASRVTCVLGRPRFVLFHSGECFGGPDDPAKRGNHQQAEEQSEPTHGTKLGYSAAVLSSTEIAHFGTNMFWCVAARTRPCLH